MTKSQGIPTDLSIQAVLIDISQRIMIRFSEYVTAIFFSNGEVNLRITDYYLPEMNKNFRGNHLGHDHNFVSRKIVLLDSLSQDHFREAVGVHLEQVVYENGQT